MTREELITYITTEHHALMEKIDSCDERILKAYNQYAGFINKIIKADLSMEDIVDCFRSLNDLYMIKSNASSSELKENISEMDVFDPKTKEELVNGVENTIHNIKEFFLFSTYSKLAVLSCIISMKPIDLKAALEEAKERIRKREELGIVEEKKESEPPKTDEEIQIERITLLESIIGEQVEFNTIMGR